MSGNFVLSNRQNADYKIIKFNGMNKLGLFLAKNTTHILGLYFLGWAIWACLHWASLCLVQKLVYSAVDGQLLEELDAVKEVIHRYNSLSPSDKAGRLDFY